MEMIIIFITKISLFFFFFSTMLLVSPCASLHIHHHLQQQQQQRLLLQNQVNAKKLMISQPTLPRKLIFTEQVKEHEGMDFAVQKEVKEKLSEKEGQNGSNGISKKQKMMMVVVDDGNSKRGRRAKREEESEDPSQYFTMDYSRVRRRRPIHNKHNFHLPP